MRDKVDLGCGLSLSYFGWNPDRRLNPQFDGVPSVERAGYVIWEGDDGIGSGWFDLPEVRAIPWPDEAGKDRHFWTVESWEPLTLSPSIQMYEADGKTPARHGFVRDGLWVSA